MRRLSALLAAALALCAPAHGAVRVYAASSLTEAIEAVDALYAKSGHEPPVAVFASSSALARQIEAGAPADVFLSADEEWMDDAANKGAIRPDTRRDLLGNRLVLIVPAARPAKIAIRKGFPFARLVGDGKWVTGDPDSVPVGKYAKAALTNLGVWASAEPTLARAENVRSALAFVERGDAKAGIVYATDAQASRKVAVAGIFPASSHPPIVYPVALTTKAGPEAAQYVAFLRGPAARAVFKSKGFLVK